MKDLHDNILAAVGLNPTQVNSNTTTVGNIIDRNQYESMEFLLYTGALSTGVFTPLIEDGNDSGLSDAATVADTFLLPAATSVALASRTAAALSAANSIKRIGYNGSKRYVRVSLVSTTVVTTGALVGAAVVLGARSFKPVPNN